jgi:hypothetical protein
MILKTVACGSILATVLGGPAQAQSTDIRRSHHRFVSSVCGVSSYERLGGMHGGPYPPVAPETRRPLSRRHVVVKLIFPVIGSVRWHNSYNVDFGSHRHTAIDIAAPKMRPVVAPFSGTIGFKTQSFWIYGDNGYRCLGTHLNDDTPGRSDNRADPDYMFVPNLRPGDHVVAGQMIGYVGDSGKTTGPHLHFELFDRDGGLVNPFLSLKAARHLSAPRAVIPIPAIRRSHGEMRIVGCARGWNAARAQLTLLLVARQNPNGRTFTCVRPKWYRLSLAPAVIEAAGGFEAFASLLRDRPVVFSVTEAAPGKGKPVGAGRGSARRLIFPADEAGPAATAINGQAHSAPINVAHPDQASPVEASPVPPANILIDGDADDTERNPR